MNYRKLAGLLAIAVSALMAAAPASGTTLTSKAGATYGVGTKIHGSSSSTLFDGSIEISCATSTFEGEVTNAGSGSTTVSGSLSTLTFENCGAHTVTPLTGGSFEVHTEGASANNNGTFTSSGAEITVLAHLPFKVTTHCIYRTNGTDFGRVTGSTTLSGATSVLEVTGAQLPLVSTDFGCGSSTKLTGQYTIDNPDFMNVD